MSDLSKRLAALSPEMRELLLKKLAQEKATTSRSDAIATRETADSYPLSFAQQRLWFLDQYEANTSLYNVPIGLRFTGSLNVAALKGSLEQLFSRHESLRTTFVDVEGKPRQVIAEHVQVQLPLVDISGLPEADREREAWRLAKEEAKGAFDLATGPLLRTTLLRIDATDHLLLLTMHHIVTDRWSNQILKQELMERYEAHVTSRTPVLKPLAVQYADFAIWQQKQLSGQGVERLISYWKQQLQGAPALLDLPTDRPRPPLQTFAGAVAAKRLSLPLSQGIRELARTEDVTLFMLMLTAFQVLLSRYSGQSDIVVGSPISGRNREEIVGLIGFFVNTLVLRTDLSGRPSFQDALKRVRETVLSAFDHQDLPFERIVDELQIERDPSTSPLFQVTFTLQQDEPTRANGEGLQVAPFEVLNDTSKFDLELFVTDCAEGFLLELQYNTDLFDTQTATRMLAHLETLLEGVVADVAQEVDLLPLMQEAEKQQLLVTWNATLAEQMGDACIHRQFEAQVAQTPEWIAAV
ncbi:MAG: condensation domain-containing protein, partial [Tumebacillaceae bacterium]